MLEQVMRRFTSIGHHFPGYTWPVLMDMPYLAWVALAWAHDDYVEKLRAENRRR